MPLLSSPPEVDLPPLPPLPLLQRMFADERTHRAIPFAVGIALARLRVELFWRTSPGGRRDARRAMEFLLGGAGQSAAGSRLAKRHVFENARRTELLWRPALSARLPRQGVEALRRLQAEGRGVVLTFMHQGPYLGFLAVLADEGLEVHMPVAPFYYDTPVPGYMGHRDRQHLRTVLAAAEAFPADGKGLLAMPRLLRAGKILMLPIDLPGDGEAEFLGRRVRTVTAAARLAWRTGAVVVPATVHRRPLLPEGRVGTPLEPKDFPDWRALHAEIARRHDTALGEWPEALERPFLRWTPVEEGSWSP